MARIKKLCQNNDRHCFKDIFLIIYKELKAFTPQFLDKMNEKHQYNINVMPYEIDRNNWAVEWMADNHEDLQNELRPLANSIPHNDYYSFIPEEGDEQSANI